MVPNDINRHKKVPTFVFFHINPDTSAKSILYVSKQADEFFSCIRYYTKQMCNLLEDEKLIEFGFETRLMSQLEIAGCIEDIRARLKEQEYAALAAKEIPPPVPEEESEEIPENLLQFPNIYKNPDQE